MYLSLSLSLSPSLSLSLSLYSTTTSSVYCTIYTMCYLFTDRLNIIVHHGTPTSDLCVYRTMYVHVLRYLCLFMFAGSPASGRPAPRGRCSGCSASSPCYYDYVCYHYHHYHHYHY